MQGNKIWSRQREEGWREKGLPPRRDNDVTLFNDRDLVEEWYWGSKAKTGKRTGMTKISEVYF